MKSVTVNGAVSGREVVVVLEKSVTVKGAVSGNDVVVTPVANGKEDVLEKPTGEPKLELADGVMELMVEVAVESQSVVETVRVLPVAKLLGKPYGGGGGAYAEGMFAAKLLD